MKTTILAAPLAALTFVAFAGLAQAHAVVEPSEVGIGKFAIFTLGVPSEQEAATVGVRLVIPDGLNFVTPNVKSGWKVEVKKQATGKQIKDDDGNMAAEQKPIEINWTGGSIPGQQRDEFSFSAQVPSTPAVLNWKVYQTYADGSVMAWDQDPKAEEHMDAGDHSKSGPYSQTQVVDDLNGSGVAAAAAPTANAASGKSTQTIIALALSVVALVISFAAAVNK